MSPSPHLMDWLCGRIVLLICYVLRPRMLRSGVHVMSFVSNHRRVLA